MSLSSLSSDTTVPEKLQLPVVDVKQEGNLGGFLVVSLAFIVSFAATAAPIPLYSLFRVQANLSSAIMAAAMVTYLCGVLLVLLFAGKISNAIGRKKATILGLTFGALGCIMTLFIYNAFIFLVARFVMGVTGGIAMSSMASYAIDLAGKRFEKAGLMISGCAAMVGVAVGSLGIGLFMNVSSHFEWFFMGMAICLLLCIVPILFSPEPVVKPSPLFEAVKPDLRLSPAPAMVLPFAVCAYTCTWIFATYFQSFSSSLATDYFGIDNTMMASLFLILAMIPSVFGASIEARFPRKYSLQISMTAYIVMYVFLFVCLINYWLIPFIVLVTISSLIMGTAVSGSLRMLLEHDDGTENATIITVINFYGYVLCTLANLGMTALITPVGLVGVMAFVGVITFPFALVGIILCTRYSRKAEKITLEADKRSMKELFE